MEKFYSLFGSFEPSTSPCRDCCRSSSEPSRNHHDSYYAGRGNLHCYRCHRRHHDHDCRVDDFVAAAVVDGAGVVAPEEALLGPEAERQLPRFGFGGPILLIGATQRPTPLRNLQQTNGTVLLQRGSLLPKNIINIRIKSQTMCSLKKNSALV